MAQPARDESNSLVKNCGKEVGEGSRVGVGAGVSVMGMGVGGGVSVGKSGATGVGVACWQAVMRMRHPMRSFFIAPIKTQLSSALCQTIVYLLKVAIEFSRSSEHL